MAVKRLFEPPRLFRAVLKRTIEENAKNTPRAFERTGVRKFERKCLAEYRQARELSRKVVIKATEKLFKQVKQMGPDTQVIFMGRDGRPLRSAALMMADVQGLDKKNLKLVDTSSVDSWLHYEPSNGAFNEYLKKIGVGRSHKVLLVDSGHRGIQINALEKHIEKVFPGTKVNSVMVYSSRHPGWDIPSLLNVKMPKVLAEFYKRPDWESRWNEWIINLQVVAPQKAKEAIEWSSKVSAKTNELEKFPKPVGHLRNYEFVNDRPRPSYWGQSSMPDKIRSWVWIQALRHEIEKYLHEKGKRK